MGSADGPSCLFSPNRSFRGAELFGHDWHGSSPVENSGELALVSEKYCALLPSCLPRNGFPVEYYRYSLFPRT